MLCIAFAHLRKPPQQQPPPNAAGMHVACVKIRACGTFLCVSACTHDCMHLLSFHDTIVSGSRFLLSMQVMRANSYYEKVET